MTSHERYCPHCTYETHQHCLPGNPPPEIQGCEVVRALKPEAAEWRLFLCLECFSVNAMVWLAGAQVLDLRAVLKSPNWRNG